MTSVTEATKTFYKDDEHIGALYQMMAYKNVLTLLKDNPWETAAEVAAALKLQPKGIRPKTHASFILRGLAEYGLIQSEMRLITQPTPQKNGVAARFYALSDDFDKRTAEIFGAVEQSREQFASRLPAVEVPPLDDKKLKEIVSKVTRDLKIKK